MFMPSHVTLLSTEIWSRKDPYWQSPESGVWRPFWIRTKFYLTCIKVLSQIINVPNMNEIHSFMSENGPQNGSHMLSIWKTKSATWRPSWTKISKRCYLHQWATIDNVHAWPYPGHIIKYWDLAAERSILTKSKISRRAAILDQTKILLDMHQGPIIGHNCMNCARYEWNLFIHVLELAAEWKSLTDGRRTTDGHHVHHNSSQVS